MWNVLKYFSCPSKHYSCCLKRQFIQEIKPGIFCIWVWWNDELIEIKAENRKPGVVHTIAAFHHAIHNEYSGHPNRIYHFLLHCQCASIEWKLNWESLSKSILLESHLNALFTWLQFHNEFKEHKCLDVLV